ncbi:MAG: methionine--tRNA ligase subunit beta, partial [Candidatus Heimdallarchaeota archaeon]
KIAPERHDTDFLWTEFRESINNDLADILGNFIHRTLTFVNRYFDGKVPKVSKLAKIDKDVLAFLKKTAETADKELSELEFQKTLLTIFEFARECNKYFQTKEPWVAIKENKKEAATIFEFARECNKYFQTKEPWVAIKENKEEAATTLNVCIQCCKGLANLLAPYIPFSAERIYQYLNLKESVHQTSWNSVEEKIANNHKIHPNPEPLFQKIELEEIIKHGLEWGGDSIKELLEKNPELDPTKKDTEKKKKPKQEKKKKTETKGSKTMSKEMITFKDFQKLDLRTGTIKEVEPVEGTKKLLKIQVDIGTEIRQIVAGIAERYEPQELVGKQIVIICNLEPAKIRGVESNGMLLAADADPEISILTPVKEVPNGSKVR